MELNEERVRFYSRLMFFGKNKRQRIPRMLMCKCFEKQGACCCFKWVSTSRHSRGIKSPAITLKSKAQHMTGIGAPCSTGYRLRFASHFTFLKQYPGTQTNPRSAEITTKCSNVILCLVKTTKAPAHDNQETSELFNVSR